MNLANKLTMFRVVLIPFFVFFMLCSKWPFGGPVGDYIALVIFVVASLTDLLDGKIARKYNLVTNFGKFMDPLADKLLVCSALICLVELNRLAAWMVVIIIAREFIISGFRLIAADNNVVIAASMWGKYKTTFQMAMVILLILNWPFIWFEIITGIVTWIAVILTVVSLIDYLVKNKGVMKDQI
ncbi:MAG: CDP-diacylglycerol--glycerol-3-phosphate 3-phosphatidyltransferase [Eubacterium sp.]|nr:CDP-diacylglycerol--glycerol-3-phosphate 3-phosphatidyltransferase [Eubacterium sp.]